MDLSKPRQNTIKRALTHYRKWLLVSDCLADMPPENIKVEINQVSNILNDFKLIDALKDNEDEIPSGKQIEQLINEETEALIDTVPFNDMKIKANVNAT